MAWRPENFCRVRPYPNSSKPTAFNIEGEYTMNQTFQKIVGGVLAVTALMGLSACGSKT